MSPLPSITMAICTVTFTYVDDIVTGIENLLPHPPQDGFGGDPYRIYNIGNSTPVKLMTFIEILEKALGKEAQKGNTFLCSPVTCTRPLQMYRALKRILGFKTDVRTIEEGLKKFAQWYKAYYHWTA